ncbi:benzyl alcohol O-benzoyltransferase-like [Quercus lobata]|uniref:benzyl alcohol O-benzoyltransferase-like n=1 Tax=Quercus lobata TaxID=97700 RepID=UPI00124550A0|nr:benzyl alcohol O-benzoyltransferase-like [Quercus lobata]
MAIMAPSFTSLVFTVRRCEPELVSPAKPTPNEFKQLSDLDDRDSLRFQIPIIQFYKYNPSMQGRDTVKIIREALSKTLVFYYPFAGRLREGPGAKLMVECTGEGVMFIEADADVSLDQFGHAIHPPFPCIDELLYDVPGSGEMLNCPLLLIQVTRLRCGGFIFALRLNHLMSDAPSIVQFMNAMGEMARGVCAPSIPPVWQRELLNARNPPQVTCTHHEFDELVKPQSLIINSLHELACCSFFFGSTEVCAIRKRIPHHLGKYSTFEVLTAFMWRCRTIALSPDPEDQVRLIFMNNVRAILNPPLPRGYYGNAYAISLAVTTARELCENPLEYALELVRKAKANVNDEYIRSFIDLVVSKGRPRTTIVQSFVVSNTARVGFRDVDCGWGKAIYGGVANIFESPSTSATSFYIEAMNSKGEDGIMVPMCLPTLAMERFVQELNNILQDQSDGGPMSKFIISSM